jgi:hypothetical protein
MRAAPLHVALDKITARFTRVRCGVSLSLVDSIPGKEQGHHWGTPTSWNNRGPTMHLLRSPARRFWKLSVIPLVLALTAVACGTSSTNPPTDSAKAVRPELPRAPSRRLLQDLAR